MEKEVVESCKLNVSTGTAPDVERNWGGSVHTPIIPRSVAPHILVIPSSIEHKGIQGGVDTLPWVFGRISPPLQGGETCTCVEKKENDPTFHTPKARTSQKYKQVPELNPLAEVAACYVGTDFLAARLRNQFRILLETSTSKYSSSNATILTTMFLLLFSWYRVKRPDASSSVNDNTSNVVMQLLTTCTTRLRDEGRGWNYDVSPRFRQRVFHELLRNSATATVVLERYRKRRTPRSFPRPQNWFSARLAKCYSLIIAQLRSPPPDQLLTPNFNSAWAVAARNLFFLLRHLNSKGVDRKVRRVSPLARHRKFSSLARLNGALATPARESTTSFEPAEQLVVSGKVVGVQIITFFGGNLWRGRRKGAIGNGIEERCPAVNLTNLQTPWTKYATSKRYPERVGRQATTGSHRTQTEQAYFLPLHRLPPYLTASWRLVRQ
ncbi:hypothetical protein GOBAR_AA37811 [Gossypium barbadense]|uniref:Uncharacterized protein n=1 Tax=Gossypium barbadense TaxID=3634 RepID=A0A2P5VVM9_GOSBA|nr:hypothetical protein GOBAR_AA37811 [Gossypium barbadense]